LASGWLVGQYSKWELAGPLLAVRRALSCGLSNATFVAGSVEFRDD
jgi:hypothetical protein